MADYDFVAERASAGGVEALQELASALPAEFPAAIVVGPLRAFFPGGCEPIQPGHIYVAPPDRDMLAEQHKVQLWRGPKENRHRPGIDPLFRSVAVDYGARAIGVILTGRFDEGSTGRCGTKKYGAVAIVPDPAGHQFPEMARSASEYVQVAVARFEMGPFLAGACPQAENGRTPRGRILGRQTKSSRYGGQKNDRGDLSGMPWAAFRNTIRSIVRVSLPDWAGVFAVRRPGSPTPKHRRRRCGPRWWLGKRAPGWSKPPLLTCLCPCAATSGKGGRETAPSSRRAVDSGTSGTVAGGAIGRIGCLCAARTNEPDGK